MRKIDLEGERRYQNSKADGENPRAKQAKYSWAIELETDRHTGMTIERVRDRRVLEIGCASGYFAEKLAASASTYVGIDISDKAIEAAAALGIGNAVFLCGDGHRIPFPDGDFDCVVVNALLHHLDLASALDEISRLLREGGALIFREPLGINQIFQLYRRFTPSARTPDERPFTWADLKLFRSKFKPEIVRYAGLLGIASAFTGSKAVRSVLSAVDRVLSVTPLKYLFWQISGVAVKRSPSGRSVVRGGEA